MPLTILDALNDPDLFGNYLDGDPETWRAWKACLRAVYGLPIRSAYSKRVIREVTGRNPDLLPEGGFDTTLFLTGRKSGKSKIAGLIAAFEAAFSGREKRLSPGERGIVIVVSPSRRQSKIVHEYISAAFNSRALRAHKIKETGRSFELSNGITIEVMANDFRNLRGPAIVAAVVDEACFLGQEEASQIKTDTELINAIEPAMSVVEGRLICISSPYARRGWMYKQWENHFKNDNSDSTLVINCPSRALNPRVSQKRIDRALADDYAKARAEYFGEWRDDVSAFLSRQIIDAVTVKGRTRLAPVADVAYSCFVDVAGGSAGGDDASCAIVHREGRKLILDRVERWRPAFNPFQVVAEMAALMHEFQVKHAIGDHYSAEWAVSAFRSVGINYQHSHLNKSELYLNALVKITGAEVELLDVDVLIEQLASLERKTRSGGKDIVDHPKGKGHHDDVANAVCGAFAHAVKDRLRIGGFGKPAKAFPY